jgi:Putative bacterial sensory transduction regulator
MDRAAAPDELSALESLIDRWLDAELDRNPTLAAVDRGEPSERRWYVRLRGEQKDTFTIWFTLRQRTLHYETYVMPAPEENHEQFFEHLLRRNLKLYGAAFAIGAENAVFLVGQVPVDAVDEGELDRILGSMFAYVEQFFRPALHLGFASHFK